MEASACSEVDMTHQKEDDQAYFSRREAEERQKAADTSSLVRSVHRELADLYAMMLGRRPAR